MSKEKNRDPAQLIPNDAYFEILCKCREYTIPNGKADKRHLHAIEKQAVYDYYA